MKTLLFFGIIVLSLFVFCRQKIAPPPVQTSGAPPLATAESNRASNKINGLTFVAPPEPFSGNPMPAVTDVGANWIAVIPYAFTKPDVPEVRYSESGRQWWGERPVGIRESIRLAHEAGVKVMLKPQVWIPGGWTGNLDFATEASWEHWESSYERYILRFAALADSVNAEMFCIGTEFRMSIEKRPQFWTALIKKIKGVYHGKLTYSSNWDDWDKVPFWGELDYIGLGGYFPLVDAALPKVETLKEAWMPIRDRLKTFSAAQKKPVLFTEWGYLSVDGCGWRNWELEQGIENRNINEKAQANCMEAMLATFQPETWWAGSFLWKWFPNMRGHEGYPERDYTPQGKQAEKTLREWYR